MKKEIKEEELQKTVGRTIYPAIPIGDIHDILKGGQMTPINPNPSSESFSLKPYESCDAQNCPSRRGGKCKKGIEGRVQNIGNGYIAMPCGAAFNPNL